MFEFDARVFGYPSEIEEFGVLGDRRTPVEAYMATLDDLHGPFDELAPGAATGYDEPRKNLGGRKSSAQSSAPRSSK